MPTFETGPVGHGILASSAAALTAADGGPPPVPDPTVDTGIPGLALIPPKVVQKILRGEYVEMHELLQESWRLEEQRDSCCRSSRPKRGLVTDIALWTECYASLVAVLVTKHPTKAPQFMGYLRTIVRASRNFEGAAWASYDAAFRRQAANRKSLDWGMIDPTIYNEAFTGRAKLMPRCRYCLADTHEARECQFAPGDDPPPPKQSRSAPWGGPPRARPDRGGGGRSIEICDLYNRPEGNRCTFKWCRYAHVCAKCRRGPHPGSECGRGEFARGNGGAPSSSRREDTRVLPMKGRQ